MEGGPANNVSLRSLNASQNRSVGGHLGAFYNRCAIPANTPSRKYKVVPMKGLPITGYVCSR